MDSYKPISNWDDFLLGFGVGSFVMIFIFLALYAAQRRKSDWISLRLNLTEGGAAWRFKMHPCTTPNIGVAVVERDNYSLDRC